MKGLFKNQSTYQISTKWDFTLFFFFSRIALSGGNHDLTDIYGTCSILDCSIFFFNCNLRLNFNRNEAVD